MTSWSSCLHLQAALSSVRHQLQGPPFSNIWWKLPPAAPIHNDSSRPYIKHTDMLQTDFLQTKFPTRTHCTLTSYSRICHRPKSRTQPSHRLTQCAPTPVDVISPHRHPAHWGRNVTHSVFASSLISGMDIGHTHISYAFILYTSMLRGYIFHADKDCAGGHTAIGHILHQHPLVGYRLCENPAHRGTSCTLKRWHPAQWYSSDEQAVTGNATHRYCA